MTADIPEGLYLSLRNTHIEIRDLGGVVEGSRARVTTSAIFTSSTRPLRNASQTRVSLKNLSDGIADRFCKATQLFREANLAAFR